METPRTIFEKIVFSTRFFAHTWAQMIVEENKNRLFMASLDIRKESVVCVLFGFGPTRVDRSWAANPHSLSTDATP